jgi:hypothetical protein
MTSTVTPGCLAAGQRSRDPHRQAEALRAALGLTLRGARIEITAAAPRRVGSP